MIDSAPPDFVALVRAHRCRWQESLIAAHPAAFLSDSERLLAELGAGAPLLACLDGAWLDRMFNDASLETAGQRRFGS